MGRTAYSTYMPGWFYGLNVGKHANFPWILCDWNLRSKIYCWMYFLNYPTWNKLCAGQFFPSFPTVSWWNKSEKSLKPPPTRWVPASSNFFNFASEKSPRASHIMNKKHEEHEEHEGLNDSNDNGKGPVFDYLMIWDFLWICLVKIGKTENIPSLEEIIEKTYVFF